MLVYAYKCPRLIEALKSRKFFCLNMYLEAFEIQGDMLFSFEPRGEKHSPLKDAMDDYAFNEFEEYRKLIDEYADGGDKLSWEWIRYNINPVF